LDIGESLVLTTRRGAASTRDAAIVVAHELKTKTVDFLLAARLTFKHCPDSIGKAFEVAAAYMGYGDAVGPAALDNIVSDRTLAHHAIILEQALDRCIADRMAAARKRGDFIGHGFASDESPPSSQKNAGLRFQITQVYCNIFHEARNWDRPEYAAEYPFTRYQYLTDIVHAPSKLGGLVGMYRSTEF
jgi:hypothetical protein